MSPVAALARVTKRYPGGVDALRDVSLRIESGERVAIVGPSGSGKSTMLHVLGTLERPTAGRVEVLGVDLAEASDDVLANLRARAIGFVFQRFFLIEALSARANVATGLLYAGTPRAEREARATEALERVGLGHRLDHPPSALSGGEQQRVAIARAIARRPVLVLADEPTGNLDSAASAQVLSLLRELAGHGTTVVTITHDAGVAAAMDRVVAVHDGRIRDPA